MPPCGWLVFIPKPSALGLEAGGRRERVPEVTRPTPRDPAGLDGLVLIATKDVLSHPVQSCCSASSSDASKRKKVWNRPASLKDQRDSFRSKQNQARNCISPRNLSTRLEPAVAPSLSLRDYRPLRLLSQRDYNVTAHHLTTSRPTSNSDKGTRNIPYSRMRLEMVKHCRIVALGLADAHSDRVPLPTARPMRRAKGVVVVAVVAEAHPASDT
jgi:hypothetical protein